MFRIVVYELKNSFKSLMGASNLKDEKSLKNKIFI